MCANIGVDPLGSGDAAGSVAGADGSGSCLGAAGKSLVVELDFGTLDPDEVVVP